MYDVGCSPLNWFLIGAIGSTRCESLSPYAAMSADFWYQHRGSIYDTTFARFFSFVSSLHGPHEPFQSVKSIELTKKFSNFFVISSNVQVQAIS
jgi:hypothetical protein